MTDHFMLDCDPAELTAAETKLGWLHDHLTQEGTSLARLHGDSSGWTGAAASACLGETATISATMTTAAPKLNTAAQSVRTFRVVMETATHTTLPKLNSRWEQAGADYDAAASKADNGFTNEVRDFHNLPDQDAAAARQAAAGVRDRAVNDASIARAGEHKGINGDYDTMLQSLQQAAKACGAALAGTVPITFTADQWASVKGGKIPIGMLMTLRSQVLGPDSLAHHSDGIVTGEYVASKLDDEAKNDEPGDPIDPEVVALMDQLKGDPGFTEGLLTQLGPGGAAFLNLRVRSMFESGEDGAKKQGQQMLAILTDVYGTGSNVRVPTDSGQTRPLMDQNWLDNFNPQNYDKAREEYQGAFRLSTFVDGYRPDLLLPFMTKAGVFSSDFSQIVTQQALEDYENSRDVDSDPDAIKRWFLYSGSDSPMENGGTRAVMTGDSSNPFRTDLFHIPLDRTAEHPLASNSVMMTHRDTMLQLMTGKADWLTGDDNSHDWASPALASILKQATVGSERGNMNSADAVLWGVADYLKSHHDDHMVKNVQIALGDVVTDKRFMDGAMGSVTGPFGSQNGFDGYRDDPNHPELGPLMNTELWQALHQEAMRQPDTAAKIIAQVGAYIDAKSLHADNVGYHWDPTLGKWAQDLQLTSLDRYQVEAARHFLGTNLKADVDAITAELEKALERNGKDKDLAKNILGTLVAWTTDPAGIASDVVGKASDFAVDKAVDWVMPSSSDIHDQYDKQIASLDTMLALPLFDKDPWITITDSGNRMVTDIMAGNVATEVRAGGPSVPGSGHTYSGDPRTYIGHDSYPSPGGGPPETDDFLTYGKNGLPDGVKAITEMNAAQQKAYLNWLHDPAVQKYVGAKLQAVDSARGQADH